MHVPPAMAQRKTILIIDDDPDLRELLAEQLQLHEEFDAACAATAAEGIRIAKDSRPDLILLDVDLPDMNGREACRLLRRSGVVAPVIMVTAASGESDTILGLDSGASDYVTKPFKFNLLLARIRAQLRSHEQSEDAVFRIGIYEFRPAVKVLIDEKGKKLRLTDKEASILKYLYRAGSKPVSREELLAEVWGLQRRRHDAYARDPHLPPAPEDRTRPRQLPPADHRGGGYRLSP